MSGLKKIKNVKDSDSSYMRVSSKGRRNPEFFIRQIYKGGVLFIDGQKICPTKHNHIYLFHMQNNKIDHFEVIKPNEIWDWGFPDYDFAEDPANWCDGCIEESDDPLDY